MSEADDNTDDLPPPLLRALYRISRLTGRVADSREAMRLFLREAAALTGADSGAVLLLDPDTGCLEAEACHGSLPEVPLPRVPPGEGWISWSILHAKPVRLDTFPVDPRCQPLRETSQSQLVIPVLDGDQVVGALVLESDKPAAFDDRLLAWCEQLTAEAARVAANCWRIEQLTNKAGQLEAVLTAGQSLLARLDLPVILETIARAALPLSDCRLASILLLSPGEELLKPRVAVLPDGCSTSHPDLSPGESSVGLAVQRRRQVEVRDLLRTEESAALLAMAQREKLASLLCTPIFFEGEPLGVLNLYTARPHRFSNEEKRIVQAMAGFGAVAIQNARLYARVMRSEETLRQSEKLTVLGLLAAEIAHEIRNPLTVLKLLFQSLNLSFGEGDPRQRDLEIIHEKLNQLEETITNILGFSRPTGEAFTPLNTTEMVRDTLLLVRHKLAQAGADLQFEPPLQPIWVEGNKGQLQQALLNLMLNSMQAMKTGGRMSLTLAEENGREAVIEITDSGSGIPPPLRGRIFERFLTGRQEGTGLGLPIVKRIVEGHRGTLELVATGTDGTTFRIRLPRCPEPEGG